MSSKHDYRNDLARARDAWMASKEGEGCQDGTASGQYLRNRLERAYIAGWNARDQSAPRRAETRGEQRLSKAQLDVIQADGLTPEQLNHIGRRMGRKIRRLREAD